jgi:hypothetical protein
MIFMSMARKCDRCGKFYEKNRVKWNYVGSITRGIDVVNKDDRIAVECDLCDSCIEDFRAFMDYYDDKEVDRNGEEGTE